MKSGYYVNYRRVQVSESPTTHDLAAREAEHPFAEMTCLRQLVTRAFAPTCHPTQKSGAFELRFL